MKQYTSKLLLFGEHTIIKGSQALAMPLPHFFGSWKYTTDDIEKLQMDLPAFVDYLEKLKNVNELLCNLNISKFREELNKGLYFDSNIPTGYGVGSSGALCAAVYDTFGKNQLEKNENNFFKIKKILAQLESYFHGASSGTDPLVCLVEKTLLFEDNENIRSVEILKNKNNKKNFQFFLLDTQIPRQTEPFVNIFLEKCKDDYYYSRLQAELIPNVDDAIAAYTTQNSEILFEKIHRIGHFQFKYFSKMIPSQFRTIWLDGLASDLFKFKLCGAGGGGFLLGFTSDFKQTQKHLSDYQLIAI